MGAGRSEDVHPASVEHPARTAHPIMTDNVRHRRTRATATPHRVHPACPSEPDDCALPRPARSAIFTDRRRWRTLLAQVLVKSLVSDRPCHTSATNGQRVGRTVAEGASREHDAYHPMSTSTIPSSTRTRPRSRCSPSDPGETFRTVFTRWAGARPPHGALRDGWDFARDLASADRLPGLAARELAARDVHSRNDGHHQPRPRRLPAMRRVVDGWLVGPPGFGVCLVGCPSGVLRRHTG
jgi:hypothetical protein